MDNRRAERLRLFDSKVMHRADFELRDGVPWTRNEELASFLRFSNMQILRVGPDRPLRARLALFPHLTFAHVSSSPAVVLWPRDENSVDRVLAIVTRVGGLEVETTGVVLRRPGVTLVCPGSSSVTVSMTAEENEVLYASISPALLDGVRLPTVTRFDPSPADPTLLTPAVMFMAGVCRISTSSPSDASPLRLASRQIARTLIAQIIGDVSRPAGLFARAMEIIVADHFEPGLTVAVIAERLGVATRTLQLAFTAENTTVGAQLREVRAREALRLHAGDEALTYAAISRAVGFGSESALYRALREVQTAEPATVEQPAA